MHVGTMNGSTCMEQAVQGGSTEEAGYGIEDILQKALMSTSTCT